MLRISTFFFILLFSFSASAQNNSQIIWWNSKQAQTLLEKSKYKNDFYQLVNFYQPQINPLYCGIATSVMILNAFNYDKIASQKAIEVLKLESMGGGVMEYKIFSQANFLDEKTDKVKNKEIIELKKAKDSKENYDPGLTLDDLSGILTKVHKLKTTVIHADKNDEQSIEKFRNNLKKYLNEDKNFIIVNFDGKLLGSCTRGHISPVVAYDEESDSVLVLDVALHKNRWYFVPVKKLYEAMNSKDGEKYRGYLIVKK